MSGSKKKSPPVPATSEFLGVVNAMLRAVGPTPCLYLGEHCPLPIDERIEACEELNRAMGGLARLRKLLSKQLEREAKNVRL